MSKTVRIEYPKKSDGLFRLPREKWRWVREIGWWPPRSTKKVMTALRAKYVVLNKATQIALIIPETGHESGVWEICVRLFRQIDEEEATKLLEKRGLL